jgi:DNA-binding response OmpR family regulator
MRLLIDRELSLDVGLELDFAADFRQGLAKGINQFFDLYLIDYYLGTSNGIRLMQDLVEKRPLANRVVLMSAAINREIELAGYELGVSNIVKKPLDFQLLRAIIKKNLRMLETQLETIIHFSNLSLDIETREVLIGRQSKRRNIHLTPTEFGIFQKLVNAKGRVVPKEVLSIDGRDPNKVLSFKTMEMHLSAIRKKISPFTNVEIVSRWGVGYLLVDRESESTPIKLAS